METFETLPILEVDRHLRIDVIVDVGSRVRLAAPHIWSGALLEEVFKPRF